jgi:HSP20 family protein
MSKDDTGSGGLGKIARGLSDLFTFLAEHDDLKAPRSGRREKDGVVFEYSFGKRSLVDEPDAGGSEADPQGKESAPRRKAPPGPVDVEPVMDMFDEPNEVIMLFEIPGVEKKDVRCVLEGDILLLEAKAADRVYRKEALIEAPLAKGEPHLRLRNGVLEVRLAKRK